VPGCGRERGDREPDDREPDDRRRNWLVGGLLAQLPLSVLAAITVLALMASASAAATGGCGGG